MSNTERSNSDILIKRAEYIILDSAVRPHLKMKTPAKPQNKDKKAGSANKLRGNIKISNDISTNKDADIQ